ncbi:MAG: HAD-IB family hydrolase [Coriobacteriales bacterium]|jgi:HAD superfamily hydrolase (TIGR01490 family)|nr:HAD-IB family hydrolase [Coriobacteriales bacterium]
MSKADLVTFDLDGTLIDTHSPVRLAMRLLKTDLMSKFVGVKLGIWALRYKAGRELDQSVPKAHIFRSLRSIPRSEADQIMRDLWNDTLVKYVRPEAVACIQAHVAAGRQVILVSASFEPILAEACRFVGAQGYIGVKMEVRDGYYTGNPAGEQTEGVQKLIQFLRYANRRYGNGDWRCSYAYGDHYSDEPILAFADQAVCVNPDRRLEKIASREGWSVVDWPVKEGRAAHRASFAAAAD